MRFRRRLASLAPLVMLLGAAALAGCRVDAQPDVDPARDAAGASARAGSTTDPVPTRVAAPDSILQPKAPLVPRPAVVRGLYVNRWAAIGQRMWELIDVAKRTEVNALVIDVKDDRGFVLYRSRVPLAREIGADTNRPMTHERLRAILDTMRANGIYPIARIVVAKDPLLAEKRTEWAIKRRDAPDEPWLDRNGHPWLDPNNAGVWKYAADLGREAVDLGFSELQFDYVRFPDEDRIIREATFPLQRGRTRAEVIRDQLGYLRRQLAGTGVPMTIDVFGLTASDTTDMGIGQKWEMFVDRADVVLPMAYPSHYAPGSFGIGNPNAHPYAVIERTLRDAKQRSAGVDSAAIVRPWYQDFTLGPPHYGAAQVRAQIQAGYDNGVPSWLLWNPGSRYTEEALRPEGSAGGRADSTRAADSPRVTAERAPDDGAGARPPRQR